MLKYFHRFSFLRKIKCVCSNQQEWYNELNWKMCALRWKCAEISVKHRISIVNRTWEKHPCVHTFCSNLIFHICQVKKGKSFGSIRMLNSKIVREFPRRIHIYIGWLVRRFAMQQQYFGHSQRFHFETEVCTYTTLLTMNLLHCRVWWCVFVCASMSLYFPSYCIQCEQQLFGSTGLFTNQYSEKQQPPPIRCDIRPIIDASIRVALRMRASDQMVLRTYRNIVERECQPSNEQPNQHTKEGWTNVEFLSNGLVASCLVRPITPRATIFVQAKIYTRATLDYRIRKFKWYSFIFSFVAFYLYMFLCFALAVAVLYVLIEGGHFWSEKLKYKWRFHFWKYGLKSRNSIEKERKKSLWSERKKKISKNHLLIWSDRVESNRIEYTKWYIHK